MIRNDTYIRRHRRVAAIFHAGGFSEFVARDYCRMRLQQDNPALVSEEELVALVNDVKTGAVRDWVAAGSPSRTRL